MRKVKEEKKEDLPKLDVPEEYQPLENVSLDRRRPPMTFFTEEPIFIDKFNLPIVEENGAKENGTNSCNFHRHHKELSKVITGLKTRMGVLELEMKMVMSEYPDKHWLKVHKWIIRQIEQEERIEREHKKLEELRSERVKVHFG